MPAPAVVLRRGVGDYTEQRCA